MPNPPRRQCPVPGCPENPTADHRFLTHLTRGHGWSDTEAKRALEGEASASEAGAPGCVHSKFTTFPVEPDFLGALLEQLLCNRQLATYQLERRIDAVLGPLLLSIVGGPLELEQDATHVIPEFPLPSDLAAVEAFEQMHSLESFERYSCHADYLIVGRSGKSTKAYLLELKTTGKSLDDTQINTYDAVVGCRDPWQFMMAWARHVSHEKGRCRPAWHRFAEILTELEKFKSIPVEKVLLAPSRACKDSLVKTWSRRISFKKLTVAADCLYPKGAKLLIDCLCEIDRREGGTSK